MNSDALREIVAAKIDGKITNDPRVIFAAVQADIHCEFISRGQMLFMAACDLGPHWRKLAQSKTLFLLNRDGSIEAPSTAKSLSEMEKESGDE